MALSSRWNNRTHAHGTPTTWCCMASGKSLTCAMGTLCVKCTKFVWMLWSILSTSTPMMLSPLPLCLWWGKPLGHHGPTFAYTWQIVTMCRHTKTCLLSQYIKKHTQKKTKNLKTGYGIRYICHNMSLLVVVAYPDLCGSLSLHRGSRLWWWSVSTTMERSLLGRG